MTHPASHPPPAQPLVTVVVPVYNGERFLRESLDSILAQTYPHVEVLVMDNASTDATAPIIAGFGDRVRSVRQPTNRGMFANVNAGIAIARGECIAVYHADDIYSREIVAYEVAHLAAHPEVGAVFCSDIFVDERGHEYGRLRLPDVVRGAEPLSHATVVDALLTHKNVFLRCPGAMVRASVYQEIGVYRQDRFGAAADLDMWLRIAERYPITVLEDYLYCYRHSPGQASARYQRLRTAPEVFFAIMDEHLAAGAHRVASPRAIAEYEAHRAKDRAMAAATHYALGQRAAARAAIATVRFSVLTRSRIAQRWRIVGLTAILALLTRLPRIPPVASAFSRRWHVKRSPARVT